MIFSEVTAAQILAARDAGVHEFMRRPITMGDLQKRLEAVSGRPRDWIEAVAYVGPDRRRFNSADYKGPKKRRTDGTVKVQKINQALRIVISAIEHLEADPVQAARALTTQGAPADRTVRRPGAVQASGRGGHLSASLPADRGHEGRAPGQGIRSRPTCPTCCWSPRTRSGPRRPRSSHQPALAGLPSSPRRQGRGRFRMTAISRGGWWVAVAGAADALGLRARERRRRTGGCARPTANLPDHPRSGFRRRRLPHGPPGESGRHGPAQAGGAVALEGRIAAGGAPSLPVSCWPGRPTTRRPSSAWA